MAAFGGGKQVLGGVRHLCIVEETVPNGSQLISPDGKNADRDYGNRVGYNGQRQSMFGVHVNNHPQD